MKLNTREQNNFNAIEKQEKKHLEAINMEEKQLKKIKDKKNDQ